MCGTFRSPDECHVLTLTDEEKQQIRDRGQKPSDQVVYCRPCHRLMSNPATAQDLMAGMLLIRLKSAGVTNAAAMAQGFKKKLAEKTQAKRKS